MRIRTASDMLARLNPRAKLQNVLRAFGYKTKTARVQDNGRIAFAFFPTYLHVWDIQQLFSLFALAGWIAGWLAGACWLTGWHACWRAGGWVATGDVANRVVGWLIAQRLAQRLAGWRPLGWLIGWLAGWLAGG